jgi:methionyl-tRNA formyltransferase
MAAVAVITGDQMRHRWYTTRVAEEHELVGVVVEQKRTQPTSDTAPDDALLREHFDERTEAERRFFGAGVPVRDIAPTLAVDHGGSNAPEVADWIAGLGADYLLLFGCSIIREPLLKLFTERTINMHLGLSPYYRGAATNFWPLARGEPECVGATVHLATLSVDAGAILRQARPAMEVEDGAHDIGCRAIVAGVDTLNAAAAAYADASIIPVAQDTGGLLFKNADFDAEAVREMRRRMAKGLIAHYLEHKQERDARRPIVE